MAATHVKNGRDEASSRLTSTELFVMTKMKEDDIKYKYHNQFRFSESSRIVTVTVAFKLLHERPVCLFTLRRRLAVLDFCQIRYYG